MKSIKPQGKLKLIRDVLGVEVYEDETGREFVAQPDGSLVCDQVSHTPGPWHVQEYNDNCFRVMGGDGSLPVAGLGDVESKRHSPKKKANACLIAAAPDLLEILKDIEHQFSNHPELQKGNSKVSYVYHKARAAIAKAEGRAE